MGRWINWTLDRNLTDEDIGAVSTVMRTQIVPALAAIVANATRRKNRSWIARLATRIVGDYDDIYVRSADVFSVDDKRFSIKNHIVPAPTLVPFVAGEFTAQTVGVQDFAVLALLGVIHARTGAISKIYGDDISPAYVDQLLSTVTQTSGFEFADLSRSVVDDCPEEDEADFHETCGFLKPH